MKRGRPKVQRPIKSRRLEVRLTVETAAELKRAAVETGRSASDIITELVEKFVASRGF
jgi:predicted DNA-binding protein